MSEPEGGQFNLEQILQRVFKNTFRALQVMEKYNEYTVHPFGRGNLTTDGVQYSGVTSGTTETTAWQTVDSAVTIESVGAGDDVDQIDEVEFGLTMELKNSSDQTTASTIGFVWQIKNESESTWTNLHTTKSISSTSNDWNARTMSGYITPAAGYNRLPFNIRLRMMDKTQSKGRARIKNSSYVKVKAKETPAD